MDFIITGATGWLGRSIVKELLSGRSRWLNGQNVNSLRLLVEKSQAEHAPKEWNDPRLQIIYGDITKPADLAPLFAGLKGPVVIHTAGLIHPRRVKDFFAVNVDGTMNLYNAAKSNRAKRMVVLSSNSPIGVSRRTDEIFDENSPYHPYMNYGLSKQKMEEALLAQGEPPEKLVILRAPWFYGPEQPARQTLFFQMIEKGKFPVVGRGQAMRSMSYIENLVQGVLRAATHPTPKSSIYWIADKRPYSMQEVVQTVGKVLAEDFRRPVKEGNPQLPGVISDVAECVDAVIQKFGFYHQKIHVLSEMNKTIATTRLTRAASLIA